MDRQDDEADAAPPAIEGQTVLAQVKRDVLQYHIESYADLTQQASLRGSQDVARYYYRLVNTMLEVEAFDSATHQRLELKRIDTQTLFHSEYLSQRIRQDASANDVKKSFRGCLTALVDQRELLGTGAAELGQRHHSMQEANLCLSLTAAVQSLDRDFFDADQQENIVTLAQKAGIVIPTWGAAAKHFSNHAFALACKACDTSNDMRNTSALPVGYEEAESRSVKGTVVYYCAAERVRMRSKPTQPIKVPSLTWTQPFAILLSRDEAQHRVQLADFCFKALTKKMPEPAASSADLVQLVVENVFAACRYVFAVGRCGAMLLMCSF
jgi:hypothetical protein